MVNEVQNRFFSLVKIDGIFHSWID